MSGRTLRSLGAASLALAGVAALGVAPVVGPAWVAGINTIKTVVAEATLLDTQSWIMGGSGLPIPPPNYMEAVSNLFIDPETPFFPGQPTFPVDGTNPLFTPEGLYPLTGVKSLELDPSLTQGVEILNSTITNQIAAGNQLVVLGYSQSATLSALEMNNLLALPPDQQPTADELSFVLLGSPSTPDGGLLSRFAIPGAPELTLPSLGVTFSGPTPSDTPWDTAMYIREYDGFADFPRYPINLISDINAFLGIMFVHGKYPMLTPEQMATAIELPVSDDYAGHTQYFMFPTEILPILQPLLSIPLIGQPLYDLLEPDMRILVNLGYGNIDQGWDLGPADVHTPIGVWPTDLNTADVFSALANGAQEGINAFINDLSHLSFSSMADEITSTAAAGLPSLTEVVNAFTLAASTAYATLLPTADIINALLTTLPSYSAALFASELTSGDLLSAIGLPIAADVGLTTMAAGFEIEVLMNAVQSISATFEDLFAA